MNQPATNPPIAAVPPAVNPINVGAGPNIAESPFLQQPASSAPKQPSQSAKKKVPSINFAVVGMAIFLLTLTAGGIGAGLYLANQPQDTRQQAATPTGTAKVSTTPSSSTFDAGTAQIVNISLEFSAPPQIIQELMLLAVISGTIPADLQFVPADIPGMSPAIVEIVPAADNSVQISIGYISTSTSGTNISSANLEIGNMTFTTPETGEIVLSFDSEKSQLLVAPNEEDILRPPTTTTYTVVPGLFSAPPESTSEAGIEDDSDLLADAGVGGTITTSTPTRTPTRTPTPTLTAQEASDESRTSSLPAETQDQPTSGSVEVTLGILMIGLLFITLGMANWQKK